MKRKLTKVLFSLSIILITALLLNSIGATAVVKTPLSQTSYKIEKSLREKLAQMEDDDEINVSVWVEDVDHEAVKEETRSEILKLAENGEVSTDVLILLDEVASYAELEAQGAKEPSIEDTQKLIETKRAVYRRVYNEKNTQIYNELFKDTRESDKPTPDYLGSYAPNMAMVITKAQVLDICESKLVTNIYEDFEEITADDLQRDSLFPDSITAYPFFTEYKNVTGITSMQTLNEGKYIKIGLLEATGLPNTSLSCFSTAVSEGRITTIGYQTYIHASKMLSIMTGETSNFHGVACDARYICTHKSYYSGTDSETKYKLGAERLITEGANIINMSFRTGYSPNTYGDFAIWIDHIAHCHNVHVCKSSGNVDSDYPTNILGCAMAYNAIVVGATCLSNTGYERASYSKYYAGQTLQRKPDLVAPGTQVDTPVSTDDGTSNATAIVSGALAMLLRSNGYMLYNPQFAKAALLVGCKNLVGISTANSTVSNQMALFYETGAGMMNVYQSRLATADFSMCDVGTSSANHSLSINKTFIVSGPDISSGKKVRAAFCYTVNQPITDTPHISTGEITMGAIPTVMKITTPNGTVYRSNYTNDNKQIISFTPTTVGAYTLTITSNVFPQATDYAYAISIHSASTPDAVG